jgi:hypothetical protein
VRVGRDGTRRTLEVGLDEDSAGQAPGPGQVHRDHRVSLRTYVHSTEGATRRAALAIEAALG